MSTQKTTLKLNGLYQEVVKDTRLTDHSRSRLYKDYTAALKGQKVKI